jgi:hypothetical protein
MWSCEIKARGKKTTVGHLQVGHEHTALNPEYTRAYRTADRANSVALRYVSMLYNPVPNTLS